MSAEHNHHESGQGTWWIAKPENANTVFYLLVFACVSLVIFDLIYTGLYGKEGHFRFETVVGFHAIYGFVAFIFVVLSGKQLRLYLMRSEDYYNIPYTPRVDDHHHGDDHGHQETDHSEHEHSHESEQGGH